MFVEFAVQITENWYSIGHLIDIIFIQKNYLPAGRRCFITMNFAASTSF
jgi:hypothetical protein